ncbi:hypothetical protein SHI21_02990 [Bacteriovorax sp. PP10]|uniref:Uncharacterized protein n=1 Tax=Bacteriovorax antarcticus TaxID=3088717 RepID=A0ABU5VQ26_9BACT|nr:hypothetical protein [Bacteriovorax sp. PP10]MEA9355146.1 hypothetical protein [Bacteriovorax sp. PP10]
MNYKVFLFIFLFNSYASAESILDAAIRNTDEQSLDGRMENLEQKIKNNTSTSMQAITERTQLAAELENLRQIRARNLLTKAIEGTDVASMSAEQVDGNSMRLQRTKMNSGSPVLDKIANQTIKESNPAIMGWDLHKDRPFVLYRDVDPADVYVAKELGAGDKKVLVYKKKDLRGREIFLTLDGKNSNAIIQGKLFTKEEVIIRDEAGNLVKAYPKAIYADGTIEVKDQHGITTRRAQGAYHLSNDIEKVSKTNIKTYSGNEVSVFGGQDESKLSDKEKKAVEALRKAFCNL